MERAQIKVLPTAAYPVFADSLPQGEIREGRYLARFARSSEELDAILRLRFEIFNIELGEGLASSFQTGRDLDEFDRFCHHLVVEDSQEGRIVGTYRCQTAEMAAAGRGFYSAVEFDLSHFPEDVLANSIELGRACISLSHRNTQVLFLLWKGLAMYVAHNRKRYLFGCCSLTSQDESEGVKVLRMLEAGDHMHPTLSAGPQPGFECRTSEAGDGVQEAIPKLFRTYLRFGARVCGPPAIDRLFKTIDYLVLFDVAEMDAQTHKVFFGA
ncbi:MAG TPA: GNAT family N-acyltransferase [Blastocatellia bacterium]